MRRFAIAFALICIVLFAVQCTTGENGPDASPVPAGSDGDETQAEQEPPFEPLFPRSPPPGLLRVYDAAEDSVELKNLLVSLQGIVNRTEPRIFLLSSAERWPDPWEKEGFWLEQARSDFGLSTVEVDDPWELLDEFAGEVAGAVVTDPEQVHTNNVATVFAGIHDAILVDPSLLPQVEQRGLPVIEDLRGRFESNEQMYRWAFETLWPDCDQSVLAFHNAQIPSLRDYLIAHRIFTFQPDMHRPGERALLEEVLTAAPDHVPVLGWVIDELMGVMILSRHAKFHVASDNSPNLSVYSGLEMSSPGYDDPPQVPEPQNAIYVGFAYTDADNLAYIQRSMVEQWQDPARGAVPLGWSFNAAARDLAPHLVSYFHRTRSPMDVFIGPASGIGYMYPNLYPDLDGFLEITAPYYRWSGFDTAWIINDDLTLPDQVAVKYARALDLQGIFVDYWPNGDRKFHFASDGTPVLRSWYVYLLGPEQIPGLLADAATAKEQLYPDAPLFVLIGVNAWVTPPSLVLEIAEGLDSRFRVVRPDLMFGLMRRSRELGWIE